jgi:hypothetical protein
MTSTHVRHTAACSPMRPLGAGLPALALRMHGTLAITCPYAASNLV